MKTSVPTEGFVSTVSAGDSIEHDETLIQENATNSLDITQLGELKKVSKDKNKRKLRKQQTEDNPFDF